ncbi:MAG: thioeseterase, partial [Alphaproteobacteria bacterium]|nr:thioeseterase [Alphaproteobacteria bacterium]
MYPFLRMSWQMSRARRAPPMGLWDTHESSHRCWPWDLDIWAELNNGRTLTLFDLGRLPMARRIGMIDLLKARKWGMAVAGASVRYRRRVHAFYRLTQRTRCVGFDDRFLYVEQAMWRKDGACANHGLIRMAVTGPDGIVAPARVAEAL